MSARVASAAASTIRRASITGLARPTASRRVFADCQALQQGQAHWAASMDGWVQASPTVIRPESATWT